ncbi:MAG: T9SS type A sorting domain-containing protein [Bacteroidetes bacterium]|jgi:hypothetical protein|nr:T9SS type A sorting domain-containing protein [Bacteroidota bacterium]
MRAILLYTLLIFSALQITMAQPELDSATYNSNTQELLLYGTFASSTDIDASDFTIHSDTDYQLFGTSDVNTGLTPSSPITIPITGIDVSHLNSLFDKADTLSSLGTRYEIWAAATWNGIVSAEDTCRIEVLNLTTPTITSATYDYDDQILSVSGSNFATDQIVNNDIDVSEITITGKDGNPYSLSTTGDTDIITVDSFSITMAASDGNALDDLFDKVGTQDLDGNNYSIDFSVNWNVVHGYPTADLGIGLSVLDGDFAPFATGVGVTGTQNVGEVLNGIYTYNDNEGSPEGSSIYQWYRADDGTGTNRTAIAAADEQEYTLVQADENKYIQFGVTPVATTGDQLTGEEVLSSWTSPIGEALPRLDDATYNASTRILTLNGQFSTSDAISISSITFAVGASGSYTLSTTTPASVTPETESTVTFTLSDMDLARLNHLLDATGSQSAGMEDYEIQLSNNWNGTAASADSGSLDVTSLTSPAVTNVSYDYNAGQLEVTASNLASNGNSLDDIDVSQITIIGKQTQSYTLATSTDVDIDSLTGFNVSITGTDKIVLDTLFNQSGTVDADGNNYTISFATSWNAVHGNPQQDIGNTLNVTNGNFPPIASNVMVSGTYNVDEELTGSYDYNDFKGDLEENSTYQWFRADDGSGTNSAGITGANAQNYTLVAADNGKFVRFAVTPGADDGQTPGEQAFSSWYGPVGDALPRLDSARYNASGQQLTLYGQFNTGEDIQTGDMTFAVGATTYTLSSTPNATPGGASQTTITLSGINVAHLNGLFDATGLTSSGAQAYELQLADDWNGTSASPDNSQLEIMMLSTPAISNVAYNVSTGVLSFTANHLATNGIGGNDDIDVSEITITGKKGLTRTLSSSSNKDITSLTSFTIAVTGNDRNVMDTLFDNDGTNDAMGNSYEVDLNANWNLVHGNNQQDMDNPLTVSNVNYPPYVTGVSYTGTLTVGQALSGDYTYNDDEGDDEVNTEFRWYRADDGSGTNEVQIANADQQIYILDDDDEGKYIRFAVIPGADDGLTPGEIVYSSRKGPISNAGPVAYNLSISGTQAVGSELEAFYEYSDPEGDPEDVSSTSFQWYRSPDSTQANRTPIAGATDITYSLIGADQDMYIQFRVIPEAQSGTSPGSAVFSPFSGQITGEEPTATISGNDSICPGETSDSIKIILTGTPNWSVTYSIDGDTETVSGITSSPYTIPATEAGEYTLVSVSDDLYTMGTTSGAGNIYIWNTPSASLSGDDTICNSGSATAVLSLNLTGAAPWSVTYSRNGSSFSIEDEIQTTNHQFAVSDTGLYELVTVTDAHCEGSVSGDAQVDFYNIPSAQIAGNATICQGEQATITVSLNGNQPFDFKYFKVGATDTTSVTDNATSEFEFTTGDEGTFRLKEMNDNRCPGIVSGQATINKYPLASAVMSGNDSICDDGTTAVINLDFQGTQPYSFTYSIDDEDTITRSNVFSDPYSFQVTTPGLYELISMSDDNCDGQVSGQAIINQIPTPTATIHGNKIICEEDTAELMITLTGAAPWNLTYTINGTNPQSITGITSDTIYIDAHQEGNYVLTSLSDSRCGGGTTSGLGIVDHRDSPFATIFDGEAICVGDTSDEITVVFNGSAPYSFAYAIDGVPFDTINNIASGTYNLEAYLEGNYTITAMNDAYCPGEAYGSGEITINELPEVEIVGLESIYSATSEDVLLTGSPTGGTFSGSDGIIMDGGNSYFSPEEAYEFAPTHYINYQYTDPNTSCTNSDTDTVFVIGADGDIVIQNEKDVYCFNDDPFIVNGVNTAQDTGSFSISGNEGLVDNGNNTATIFPGMLEDGNFTITYTYFDDDTFELTKDIEVEYVDSIWIITDLPQEVCENGTNITLIGNNSSAFFEGQGVFGNIGSGFEFRPPQVGEDSSVISYIYTTSNGCKRQADETIYLNPIPDIDFSLDNICVDIANNAQANFINETVSTDSIISWSWNFDDINSGSANFSPEFSPSHYYSEAGPRNIELSATTINNCSASKIKNLVISDIPIAGFYTENNCYTNGDATEFTNTSTGQVNINDYKWFFGDSVLTDMEVSYTFEDIESYNVKLIIGNEYGCKDSISQDITLKPLITLTEEGYLQTFESANPAGWMSSSSSEVNSWTLGEPSGQLINDTSRAWYTSVSANQANEQSWVSSPCFSFENTKRPMVKMNIWQDFESNDRDGVILQYTTDNGRTWTDVGSVDNGIKWYNADEIDGEPGGSSMGWSGNDSDWGDPARSNLDVLNGEEYVQFRMAYGAVNRTGSADGFAFDNFWLGERSRVVLLEHFTNSADNNSLDADNLVDNITDQYPLDVIDIQYHTEVPGEDPLNKDNPQVARDRVYYYDIDDELIPFSIINGNMEYSFPGNPWNAAALLTESLKEEAFGIEITGSKSNNIISGDVTIKAKRNFTSADITLYIVIIETVIDEDDVEGINGDKVFRQVVKSMEPNSAGTNFLNPWSIGDSATIGYSYQVNQTVYNVKNLRVVAFVQDESNQLVYQAASYQPQGLLDIPYTTHKRNELSFTVYPNPINYSAYVSFANELEKEAKIEILDTRGVVQKTTSLKPGKQLYELNISGFEPGYYMINIISAGRAGIKPVMILNE